MKTKKGAGHVEIIFSFVLFISFLIFMFIVFRPLDVFSKSTSDLDAVSYKILKNISTNLSVLYPIKIDSSVYSSTYPCFSMSNPLNESLTLPLIVKDKDGEVINASREGETIYFENSENFYNIFYSLELKEQELSYALIHPSQNEISCYELKYGLGEEEYIIGLIRSYKVVSYSKLTALKDNYNANYEQVKQELGLKNDFDITIVNSPEIIFELGKEKPGSVEIMAKNFPILILNENADLNHEMMNIQVWG